MAMFIMYSIEDVLTIYVPKMKELQTWHRACSMTITSEKYESGLLMKEHRREICYLAHSMFVVTSFLL